MKLLKAFPIFAALISIFLPPPAYAKGVLENFKKPMPIVERLAKEEYEAQSKLYTDENSPLETLHFEIRVPKDWEQSDTEAIALKDTTKVLTDLVEFFSPPMIDQRQRLVVQAAGLSYQMTAEQWLIQYLLSNGFSVQGFKKWTDTKAEAAYIVIDGDSTYVVRSMAEINGRQVLYAQHFIPIEFWHDEKQTGLSIMYSFKPIKKLFKFAEDMQEHYFLDLAILNYPKSWQVKMSPIKGIDNLNAELLRVSEVEDNARIVRKLDGKIGIELLSFYVAEELEEEIKKQGQELAERGLIVGTRIEEDIFFDLKGNVDYAETFVFEASDSKNSVIDYEYWLTMIASGDYYFFITLLTPARDQNYFEWSRNTQAYKVVTENLKPLEAVGFQKEADVSEAKTQQAKSQEE